MGRPINKRNFGDLALPDNQIRITGDVGFGITAGFIVRQKSTREFIVDLGGNVGRVRLVDNVTPGVGEAFIDLFEDGSDADGSGADFTANMALATASLGAGGTLFTTAMQGQNLVIVGGASTTTAEMNIDTVVGTVVTVVSIEVAGVYQTLPTGTVATTHATGINATVVITDWEVVTGVAGSAEVAPGTLYDQAPTVTISGGGGTGATASASIAGGAVANVDILSAGAAYTTVPTISFTNAGRKFVERIKAHKVNATDGVQTQWDTTLGATPPAGQSKIDNDA